MARVGGRNSWIAVPAGLACAAVVGALVWLALPMVPVTITWAGDTLRNATSPRPVAPVADTPARLALEDADIDCRALYSDSLWNELTWRGRTILDQTYDPPATAVTSLTEVLAPEVRLTCAWTDRADGAIVTTLAVVGSDAPALAEAALRGQGFACEVTDAVLRCARTQEGTVEDHVVREGLWLSSSERAWHLEDYGRRLELQVFG
ncbi:hypothetical protein [Microbacterium sp. CFBP9034]|uniref:hypothetical protein n=1 Tax=Microbacterium sp. CFBP9034 TaxID=3096540 RepID=UPI002A6B0FDC|nr:hypothetical protein [Microbacterium sp. CFBP9034]MDY0910308.1 hypothetical protein [Microbacterium sp. CFBP9034]